MDIRFLAIDGFNLVRRIYEARKVLTADDMGAVTQAVTGSVRRALEQHQPTHAAMVFELHDRTWRHLLYAGYKASRAPAPVMLLDHIPKIESALKSELGVESCSIPNYEADDVIATIAEVVAGHGGKVIILSTDKIFLQLVSHSVHVHDHFNDRRWRVEDVEEKLGVRLDQVIDYYALVGDKSNDVAGVPGIGPRSAVELLASFDSLEDILAADNDERLVRKTRSQEAEAQRARQLVQLKTDVQLGRNLRSFRLNPVT